MILADIQYLKTFDIQLETISGGYRAKLLFGTLPDYSLTKIVFKLIDLFRDQDF